ncbi:hypothetical protein BD626DRAFT_636509 [Schizophyllum amplum]|uniref:Uncharacterized protein n=1 Tax=Schizophyllum amplum TaxID=97359 RepID=A0A550BTB3_9AGAR|nr:hypothetical protein BD626DRAFT_636509 [Auriculariopsis ampla]
MYSKRVLARSTRRAYFAALSVLPTLQPCPPCRLQRRFEYSSHRELTVVPTAWRARLKRREAGKRGPTSGTRAPTSGTRARAVPVVHDAAVLNGTRRFSKHAARDDRAASQSGITQDSTLRVCRLIGRVAVYPSHSSSHTHHPMQAQRVRHAQRPLQHAQHRSQRRPRHAHCPAPRLSALACRASPRRVPPRPRRGPPRPLSPWQHPPCPAYARVPGTNCPICRSKRRHFRRRSQGQNRCKTRSFCQISPREFSRTSSTHSGRRGRHWAPRRAARSAAAHLLRCPRGAVSPFAGPSGGVSGEVFKVKIDAKRGRFVKYPRGNFRGPSR